MDNFIVPWKSNYNAVSQSNISENNSLSGVAEHLYRVLLYMYAEQTECY